jgi:hypothetical protein
MHLLIRDNWCGLHDGDDGDSSMSRLVRHVGRFSEFERSDDPRPGDGQTMPDAVRWLRRGFARCSRRVGASQKRWREVSFADVPVTDVEINLSLPCSVAPMASAASWRNSGSIRPTTMLLLLSHRRIQPMHRIRKGQFGLWRLRVQGGTAPESEGGAAHPIRMSVCRRFTPQPCRRSTIPC